MHIVAFYFLNINNSPCNIHMRQLLVCINKQGAEVRILIYENEEDRVADRHRISSHVHVNHRIFEQQRLQPLLYTTSIIFFSYTYFHHPYILVFDTCKRVIAKRVVQNSKLCDKCGKKAITNTSIKFSTREKKKKLLFSHRHQKSSFPRTCVVESLV